MPSVGRMVKESMVDELSKRLAERSDLFVTALTKLPAADADAFRQKLSGSQAELVMIKRRLGKRALAALKVDGLDGLLEGSIALVLPGEDVLPTAKLVVDFVKAHEDQILVRGAVIDRQLLDTNRVKELASLPPRPVLLAQVVGMIESPMADVIFTLERLIGDIGWIVEQIAEQKPAAAPAQTAAPAAPEAAAQPEPPKQTDTPQQPEGGVGA